MHGGVGRAAVPGTGLSDGIPDTGNRYNLKLYQILVNRSSPPNSRYGHCKTWHGAANAANNYVTNDFVANQDGVSKWHVYAKLRAKARWLGTMFPMRTTEPSGDFCQICSTGVFGLRRKAGGSGCVFPVLRCDSSTRTGLSLCWRTCAHGVKLKICRAKQRLESTSLVHND